MWVGGEGIFNFSRVFRHPELGAIQRYPEANIKFGRVQQCDRVMEFIMEWLKSSVLVEKSSHLCGFVGETFFQKFQIIGCYFAKNL